MARKNAPYLKMPCKWWDGYKEEVLLEDVEPSMKDWLGHFLKIWTDWWNFRAEVKGGVYRDWETLRGWETLRDWETV